MRRGAAGAIALGLLLVGCGADAGDQPAAGAGAAADTGPYAGAELPGETGEAGVADDGTIEVTIADFRFSPDTITVPADGSLVVEVTNEDDVAHTFTASEIGIDVAVDPGGQGMAAASAPTAGSYQWVCRIHPSMTGTLIVE